MARVHIIGGGIAGLSAALKAVEMGFSVNIYESAGHLGGRCRSFKDETLETDIDNGNHLILSGNRAVHKYLRMAGSDNKIEIASQSIYPFYDVRTGDRWTLNMGRGRFPWWMFDPACRVPGSAARHYLSVLKIVMASEKTTLGQIIQPRHPLYEGFWEPLALAVLNTPFHEASAGLLGHAMRETFARGPEFARPVMMKAGLSKVFIEPAAEKIARNRGHILTNYRLKDIHLSKERVEALIFNQGRFEMRPREDVVIMALPHHGVRGLLPDIEVPVGSHAIVNIHYKLKMPPATFLPVPMVGLVGGRAHWVFLKGDVASVTISAADDLAEKPAENIADMIWPEIQSALGLSGQKPIASRVIKEKRATFRQSPDNLQKRPQTVTPWRNLFLAGDWTDTGLPATLEGAVRSGFRAAKHLQSWKSQIPLSSAIKRGIPVAPSVPVTPQGAPMESAETKRENP